MNQKDKNIIEEGHKIAEEILKNMKPKKESCDAVLSGRNNALYCRKVKGHTGNHSCLIEWDDSQNGDAP